MAAYYASQDGSGLADGSSIDNAWAVLSIVWATVGGGNTIYIMGEITSKITPGAASQGTDGNLTVIRGDLPGYECTINLATDFNIVTNSKSYLEIRGFTIGAVTTLNKSGIQISGASIGCYIHDNTTVGARTGIWCNGGDGNRIYNNRITLPDGYTGNGIRLSGASTGNYIYLNTLSGVKTSASFSSLILIDSASNGNYVYRNIMFDANGDGIHLTSSDSNEITSNLVLGGIKDSIAIEDSDSNVIANNFVNQDGYHGDTYPAIKIGDNFGSGTASDLNVIKNNVYYIDSGVEQNCMVGNPVGSNNVIDNNIYWNTIGPTADVIRWNGDAVNFTYSLAGWRAAVSDKYEDNGMQVDPLTDNLGTPGSNSPCIGAGAKWWTGPNPQGYSGEPFSDFATDIGGNQSTYSPLHPKNL